MNGGHFTQLKALARRWFAFFNWKRCETTEYKSGVVGVLAHGLDGELIYCPPAEKKPDTE